MSSKCGTHKTVTARFYPWFLGKIPSNLFGCCFRKKSLKPFEALLQVARGCVMLMDETEMEDSRLEGVDVLSSECGTCQTVMAT